MPGQPLHEGPGEANEHCHVLKRNKTTRKQENKKLNMLARPGAVETVLMTCAKGSYTECYKAMRMKITKEKTAGPKDKPHVGQAWCSTSRTPASRGGIAWWRCATR